MNEDKTLERLKSLNESELKALIGAVSDAMGRGETEKRLAMANTEALRKKMKTLDAEKLGGLLGRLDENQLKSISDAVGKLKNEGGGQR